MNTIAHARAYKMPFPILAGYPAGLWLVGGSTLVALGAWPDLGCLMLAAFVIPAGLIFHRYWEIPPGEARMAQNLNFMRNVTLLGAGLTLFAFFAAAGSSLDLTLTGPLVNLS
jgi:putative oxidoreductase